jgi:hypothetical protein
MPAIDGVRYKKQQHARFCFYSMGCVTKNNNTPVFNFTRLGALRQGDNTPYFYSSQQLLIESCSLSEIQSDRFVGYNARLALSVCAGFQTHSSRNQLQDRTMLKQLTSTIAILAAIGASATSAIAEAEVGSRWEYMGLASTGEEVYLNLDSISLEQRGAGYFFMYQIGEEYPFAFTPCDGRFQVVGSDGVTFGELMVPQSEATFTMLERVCNTDD